MSGQPGLGKTTLARIVAREMGGRLVETVGAALRSPDDMAAQLVRIKPHDVLFLDETVAPQPHDGILEYHVPVNADLDGNAVGNA